MGEHEQLRIMIEQMYVRPLSLLRISRHSIALRAQYEIATPFHCAQLRVMVDQILLAPALEMNHLFV